ncbi:MULTISPECIES: transglycosylase SLT domain-containing protein [unclassified Mesorhizobium]|uniref:lytic transglycosylase domain-containing protein n=1 Tax=unclassified Mesorhizobium TaxID=325217 RepID=UPI000FDC405C|nr:MULTISPECIES: transglycosylase SLT domain-containing protein [unclassified Mesorhizobium]TGQ42640.1 lytic transglycosylase domain-containing protein [Mesorhizobium sp. M00.F.Ca.ET.216.01.1.1]TIS55199.1 MAG: lytic transglycosylase domain-containing protein [Mesorhizobium sp.]TIS90031.1 MAG: lytic transglycosylase domain-containing protein [Mesorhizobium sp.]TJW14324.1 MAG: lytic transglycosylase domain-containing protein [Mesorhizobium sp.]TJW40461.1 MAG: lytic transglycosylase domain-contai
MQKLTIVTAAIAAGVMTFAIGAANGAPLSQRADQGCMTPSVKTATPKASLNSKAKGAVTAKVEKAAVVKARKSTVKRPTKRNRKTVDPTTTASVGARNAAASTSAAAGGGEYSAIIARYAASYGVPVSLANAVIRIESNYRPNLVGGAGEIGLMQIKPATARMMGYSGSVEGLFNPDTNIKYGMKYLAMAQGLGGGTTCGTILKYNAGHAATRMNPISAAYCSKVKVQMAALGTST